MPTRQSGSPRQQCIGAISAFVDGINSHIILRMIRESKTILLYNLHADGIVSLDLDFKMQFGDRLCFSKMDEDPELHVVFITLTQVDLFFDVIKNSFPKCEKIGSSAKWTLFVQVFDPPPSDHLRSLINLSKICGVCQCDFI